MTPMKPQNLGTRLRILSIMTVLLFGTLTLQAQKMVSEKEAMPIINKEVQFVEDKMSELEEQDANYKAMQKKMALFESIMVDLAHHFTLQDCIERAIIKVSEGSINEELYHAGKMTAELKELHQYLVKMFSVSG